MSRNALATLGIVITLTAALAIWLLQIKTTSRSWHIKELQNPNYTQFKSDIKDLQKQFSLYGASQKINTTPPKKF